jgi:3-oxoacyl-[acyl-carrier protein] reductase
MNIRFDERIVIVTGAAHGFGRAIARRFSELGAIVHACDVMADELEETREACGPRCRTGVVDVTDRAAVDAFVRSAEASGPGHVHVLVNNAGGVLGQTGRAVEEVPPTDWQSILDVNLTATFWLTQAVAPGMKRAGGGRIVNISSGAGLGVSLTGIQAYAAAKAAQIGLTRQLAHELGPFGVTVNNVAPGFVRSNPNTERQWQSYGEEGQAALIERIALRRLGTPADIASAVLFFASDFAGWITGEVVSVAGGR